ncbi:putative ABC transporter integral membrane protein [Microbacterium esteraromaticum]|uniref:Putative ABC transporter integral membrane protein n=1 Tax=Microbacterium esteraromaticum TaxID=57043 RepID=A0A1R4I6X9_9MICO|nr:ABC transporter permease [Microbacterium esteraromaticum]SJN15592.1 putative ABC transporter integral membrane protein [Microbacterium esteraromaticum]
MIRLAFAELRTDVRVWIGPLLVASVASAFVYLAAVYWWTLGTTSGAELIESFGSTVDEARAGSYVVYVSTAIPAIAVLGSTSAATIAAFSTRIARWRLAGATPRQVRAGITVQVLVVNTIGTAAGIAIATPLRQPAVDLLVRMVTRGDYTIPVDSTPTAALVALAGSTLVCYLASFMPARRAARIPAVHAVRDTTERTKTMPVSRWIIAGLLIFALIQQLIVTVLATQTLGGDSGVESAAATLALTLGIMMIATIGALSPIVVPALIRVWTAIVPSRVAPAWFIARHAAIEHPRQASTAVMPISIGIALYGILFGIIATWQNALLAAGFGGELNTIDTYVMLTPAALIAVTGSVASILLTTRSRTRQYALIRTAGATPQTIVGIALAEAISYSITAIGLGFAVAYASVLTAAALLTAMGLPAIPLIDLRQMLILAGIGVAALLVVLFVPAFTAIRGNPRDTVSAL